MEIIALTLSGLALFYASSMRLVNPSKANFLQTYVTKSENKLAEDVDLLNEIRGVGAVMLLGGIVILLGTIMPALRLGSFLVAVVIFLGVVFGRLISFGLDGRPNKDVIKGTFAEIVISALNIYCLVNQFMN